MSHVTALRCRECDTTFDLSAQHVCDRCVGPLEVVYDHAGIAAVMSRERVAAGPPTLWRYADLLPVLPGDAASARVDLGSGLTPLVRAPRLGAELGLADLWIKDDTRNPTNSFKDRVVTVAISAARQLGIEVVACASTGNLAHSVAAHAAATGMECVVLVPRDLEPAKITAMASYGATVVAVDGTYDQVNRLCSQVADERGWGFVNVNLRPYYAEGSKTIGFEIAEQLGWRLPGQVVAPMASGSMYVKVDKAFTELCAVGLVEATPWRMFGAQAQGCSPIAQARDRHLAGTASGHEVRPVRPDTVARSLAIGDPGDGRYALQVAERTGGDMATVTDAGVVQAMRLLARTEGILAETAGGVTIGVLARLAREGRLDPDATTVAVVSGHGLKTLDVLHGCVGPSMTIPPRLSAFDDGLAELADLTALEAVGAA